MPNLHRGEIEAILDGRAYRLCLTLGALAELEAAFGDEDMLALAERFGRGRLSARDATRIIGAGLRGAGLEIADTAVQRMQAEGGAAGFVEIVSRLLAATFGTSDRVDANDASAAATPRATAEARPIPDPFPGMK
ncbi:MAG: gene transfer agent family protein [Hyphomicrobiaceae bacterium]